MHSLFHIVQCTSQRKIPDSSSSIVKKIVHPNCTYGFVIDVTLGYDPIVLEDVGFLVVLVRKPDLDIEVQGFNDPFNTVSV